MDNLHFSHHTAESSKGLYQSLWSSEDPVLNAYKSESFNLDFLYSVTDLHKQKPQNGSIELSPAQTLGDTVERVSDANVWLPHAASVYKLSSRLEDYVLVPVVGMFSSLPNVNGDSVTLQELLRFNPFHGQQSYRIWKGQPTFVEHDNQDVTRSKGVILDVYLRPLRRFGNGKYYKLVLLHAFDRTKDSDLVNRILQKSAYSYSVGFYFKSYQCSICGHLSGGSHPGLPCQHTMPGKKTYLREDPLGGLPRIAYRNCFDIKPFESSSVAKPAFITAISDHVMDPQQV